MALPRTFFANDCSLKENSEISSMVALCSAMIACTSAGDCAAIRRRWNSGWLDFTEFTAQVTRNAFSFFLPSGWTSALWKASWRRRDTPSSNARLT